MLNKDEIVWLDKEKKERFRKLRGIMSVPISLSELLIEERWKEDEEITEEDNKIEDDEDD